MDDVLTGSFILALLSLAGWLGLLFGRVNSTCARRKTSAALAARLPLRQAIRLAIQPDLSFERWLARVMRAVFAPSSDEPATSRALPFDPRVDRLALRVAC